MSFADLDHDPRAQALLKAENDRCNALVERDFERLRQILSPDLTHTHTRGNVEDMTLYLALLQGPMEYLAIERSDMTVRLYGDTGVLDGIARTTGRLGDGEPMTLTVRVLQLWREEQGVWRMIAFQGTTIV